MKRAPENLETIGDPGAIGVWTYQPGSVGDDIATARELVAAFHEANPDPDAKSPWAPVLRRLDPPIQTTAPMGPVNFVGSETARARKALELEAAALASQPTGGRNPACNTSAFKLGRYVCSGELDETTITNALFDAMTSNGSVRDYGADACRGTINSGLTEGRKRMPSKPLLEGNPLECEARRVREASGSEREKDKVLFTAACRLHRRPELDAAHVEAQLVDAARVAGIPAEQAKRTIDKAREVVDRREGNEPEPPEWMDDEAPEPEAFDPDTGEVIEADEYALPGGLRLPKGFEIHRGELVRVDRNASKAKQCPECGEVCKLDAVECPAGHALPEHAPEQEKRTTVARCPMWIGAELVRPSAEGNLWRVDALVDGRTRHVVVDRSLKHDAKKLAMAIEGAGISILAGRSTAYDVATYLDRFDHMNRKRLPRKQARTQFGWDERCRSFLLGSECIGSEHFALYSGGNSAVDRASGWMRAAGDPSVWRDTAQEMIEASPVAALVLAASVASPMLRPFGWAPMGVALASLGGGNKSTLLRLGASVWGFHGDGASRQAAGIVGNGNSTALAVVGQFTSMADLPHLVDELRANVTDERGRHGLETALHQLIDGVERARMKQDGSGPRNIAQAVGCAVVATETDCSEFLTKGGAVRRFMPAPAPYATRPLGGLIEALCSSYGHAGRAIVQALVDATPEARKAMADRRGAHLAELREGLDQSNEALRTWSDQIAVALGAADVACQVAEVLMPDHGAWTAQILSCWEALRQTGATAAGTRGDVVRSAYDLTIAWIGAMRAHLRPSPARSRILKQMPEEDRVRRARDLREPVIGRVYLATDEGEEDEALEVVDIIQGALSGFLASKGHSFGTMAAEWRARGWIATKANRRGHSVNVKIGGTQVECYRVHLPSEEGEES